MYNIVFFTRSISSSSDGFVATSPPPVPYSNVPIEQMLNIMDTSINHGNLTMLPSHDNLSW